MGKEHGSTTTQRARTLNEFECHYTQMAQPFEWDFTRKDLAELLERLNTHHPELLPTRLTDRPELRPGRRTPTPPTS